MEISRTGIALGVGAVGLVFAVSAQAADRSAGPEASETAVSTAAPLISAAPSTEPSPSSESDVVDQTPTPEPSAPTDFESEMKSQIQLTQEFAATLLGMNVVEAEALAKSQGFMSRIVERDGESFMITMDYRTNRVNLIVENDIITKAHVG